MSGPSHNIFTTEEDISEMQFVTMVVGDESSELTMHRGYDGERSTT